MKKSISRFLLINLLISITIASSLSMVGNYVLESRDISSHLDARLKQIASFISESLSDKWYKKSIPDIQEKINATLSPTQTSNHPVDIAYQVWNSKNVLILRSNHAPEKPLTNLDIFKNHFSSEKLEGGVWRTYTIYNPSLKLLISVAEPNVFRKNLQESIIWDNLFVLLWMYPILGLLIWIVVNRGLSHLTTLSHNLAVRDTTDFSTVDATQAPEELLPVIEELNKLFLRLNEAFDKNKHFSADAAHELRTPLAALKTHAQVLVLAKSEEEKKTTIEKIIHGVNRCTHIVQQLLTLSRIGQTKELKNKEPLNISALATDVLAQLAPEALSKNIDIELISPEKKAYVMANEISLGILIRNLVDNAIRYTPKNGEVKVCVKIMTDKSIILSVIDTGPGINEKLHDRVFERFYRALGTKTSGSGLGLPIVRQIADLHNAKIKLSKPVKHNGLQIDIVFPGIK